jgi:beta-galactosidase
MRNKYLSVLLLSVVSIFVFSQAEEHPVRITQLINLDWKFHFGNNDQAMQVDLDDSSWRKLDLPHDFQIEQEWTREGTGARGFKKMSEAWYRKTFKADPAWKGKKVLLDIEGIMLHGDAYVNGVKVGGTDYGYLGFDADISELISYDADNVIAVHANTGKTGSSRWYTGGGLYRDVHIVVKNSIAVARNGIYIHTPKVSHESAEISVQVEIEGMRGKINDVMVQATIFSPEGVKLGMIETAIPKKNKLPTIEVQLPLMNLANPQLWSCESPHLYTAEIAVVEDGRVLDQLTENFGVRWIEYSKDFGFKLNGEKVFLKGISNHHDLGAVGVAAHEYAIERMFLKLKEFGYNHVRCSHNPYSKSFYRLADKHGILITDELFDKWSSKDYWPGRVSFHNLWYKAIPEWIKRDRNHPSIILWSLGNELQIREDWTGFAMGDWGVTAYKILDVLVKRFDDTRPTTVAMFPARIGAITKNEKEFETKVISPELAVATEIASYNYRWMSYSEYLKHDPDLIIYQSEATTNELAQPYFGMDYDRMVGLAYWGAIEYWGESNGWPKKGWNYSFFNHALEPHPQAYLIKSVFEDDPLVYIGVSENSADTIEWNDMLVGTQQIISHWNFEKGSKQNIFTYTNADEVELFINGKSFGIKQNIKDDIAQRNKIYWQSIPYQAGRIVAVARSQGKEVARHQLETTGKAVALRLEVENTNWKADGADLQYVKVYAVDSKGRKVMTADPHDVVFDVSGSAKLIAVDNGDHYSDELFAGNNRKLYRGFALAILRSETIAGTVKIKASSKGLRSAETKLLMQ